MRPNRLSWSQRRQQHSAYVAVAVGSFARRMTEQSSSAKDEDYVRKRMAASSVGGCQLAGRVGKYHVSAAMRELRG